MCKSYKAHSKSMHCDPPQSKILRRKLWASCWLPGTHVGTIANNNIYSTKNQLYMWCRLLNCVLTYISDLCTATVEQQELHKDITCTLNSESRQDTCPTLSIIFHNDEYCIMHVATIWLKVPLNSGVWMMHCNENEFTKQVLVFP